MPSKSVTDPGLRAIRNPNLLMITLYLSVTDPGLRAIRNVTATTAMRTAECNRSRPASNPQQ